MKYYITSNNKNGEYETPNMYTKISIEDKENFVKKLKLNDDLETIESFNGNNLEELVVNDKLSVINDYAFASTKLKDIQLSKNMKYIGNYAFFGCTNLESVTFNSVPYIGDNCFTKCNNLKKIVFNYNDNTATINIGENFKLNYIKSNALTKQDDLFELELVNKENETTITIILDEQLKESSTILKKTTLKLTK